MAAGRGGVAMLPSREARAIRCLRVGMKARTTDPYGFRRALRELGWEPARLFVAEHFLQRLVGMIALKPCCSEGSSSATDGNARRELRPPSVVMAFPRCSSIHTCLMRMRIDVAFLDRDGKVLAVYRNVRPWRICSYRGAVSVIERLSG